MVNGIETELEMGKIISIKNPTKTTQYAWIIWYITMNKKP